MALERDFLDDCPYGPGALLIDEILCIDKAQELVRARMPTHDQLPLTRDQRTHPTRHPPHVSGGLMVHLTGMIGFIHAYYVMGLRHHEGWIGYGVRIHKARYPKIASLDAPLILEGRATKTRVIQGQRFVRYQFDFRQEGAQVYEGDQTAAWTQVDITQD